MIALAMGSSALRVQHDPVGPEANKLRPARRCRALRLARRGRQSRARAYEA